MEAVEQLLVELHYGFTQGLLDDERFYEEKNRLKAEWLPGRHWPKSFAGAVSGAGFEMNGGVFRGRRVVVSKGVLSDGRKVFRTSFPVSSCFEEWRITRFFPENLTFTPSNLVYGARDPNEPSTHGARNYFKGREQSISFCWWPRSLLSEIRVVNVYRKGS